MAASFILHKFFIKTLRMQLSGVQMTNRLLQQDPTIFMNRFGTVKQVQTLSVCDKITLARKPENPALMPCYKSED